MYMYIWMENLQYCSQIFANSAAYIIIWSYLFIDIFQLTFKKY
jgi:hypothetical protein